MIPRVLEPEAMETIDEVRQYDAMDHSEVNARVRRRFPGRSRALPRRRDPRRRHRHGADPDRAGPADSQARVLALDPLREHARASQAQYRLGRLVRGSAAIWVTPSRSSTSSAGAV